MSQINCNLLFINKLNIYIKLLHLNNTVNIQYNQYYKQYSVTPKIISVILFLTVVQDREALVSSEEDFIDCEDGSLALLKAAPEDGVPPDVPDDAREEGVTPFQHLGRSIQ